MKHIIIAFLIITSLTSCNLNFFSSYLGATLPKTDQVEVFVDQSQIIKPYRILGKFYTQQSIYRNGFQKFIIKKAKSVGADAILYIDSVKLTNVANDTRGIYIDTASFLRFSQQPTIISEASVKIIFLKYK